MLHKDNTRYVTRKPPCAIRRDKQRKEDYKARKTVNDSKQTHTSGHVQPIANKVSVYVQTDECKDHETKTYQGVITRGR